jgi:hypothetical protein
MSVLSEIEKQKKHVMFSSMKDVESYYPDDVEVVPFELVRPLVEKLERENADLKQDYDKLLKESNELADLAEKIRNNNVGLRAKI